MRSRKPRCLAVAAAAGAILTFGAASPALHSAPAPIKSTCDLITKAEMENTLGVPMRNPEPQIFGNCEYRSVGDHPYKSVRLQLGRAQSRAGWEKDERAIDPDVKPIAVPGVGDAALFWTRVLDARLALIKGQTTLSIVVDVGKMMPTTSDALPVAHRLAQMALGRMN